VKDRDGIKDKSVAESSFFAFPSRVCFNNSWCSLRSKFLNHSVALRRWCQLRC